jgi:glycine cleavage system transcriptional repressor
LTLTGEDRIGLVEDVTKRLLELGGNVETSRMARLGGEFAILMLVALPPQALRRLAQATEALTAQGYKVTAGPTESTYAEAHPGWRPFQIQVHGADHEGIVHEIAHSLAQRGISIETMDTDLKRASTSGVPLFSMTARVVVPPSLADADWQAELHEAGHRLNVDVEITI